jgi:hypothetical protein
MHVGRFPCGAPLGTGVQTPSLPLTSHASHCPAQRALQHTLSTQMPLLHWPSAEHALPASIRGMHMPPAQ